MYRVVCWVFDLGIFITSPIESTKEIFKFLALVILGLTAIAALLILSYIYDNKLLF